jgi:non-specific serine/threonine protein kinase
MTDDLTRAAATTKHGVSPALVTFSRQEQSSRLTNLPVSLSRFIGRTSQLAEIEQRLLAGTRLLTLTGVGGVGKTRLALQVARKLLPQFADGVWLIDLAPLADPALVPQAIALVLEVRQVSDQPLLATLTRSLQHTQLLLVLDNCEHLVAACAEIVHTLLQTCPHLSILVTSREALEVEGEQLWSVPPLSVPPVPGASKPPPSAQPAPPGVPHEQYEAVQLFLERARAVRPTLSLTQGALRALGQICVQLDGLPLALELAAARMQVLSVEYLAEHLAERFQLLTGGNRTALPRHQTLHATLEWSYSLLTEPERVLLRRTAIFASGWMLEAAEAVCAGDGLERAVVLDTLAQLVKKSLVVVEEQEDHLRFRLLETVRQYGHKQLVAAQELTWSHNQHLAYFLTLIQRAEAPMLGADMTPWMRRLERELADLRAALDWALESRAYEQALALAGQMGVFFGPHGMDSEGNDWLEEALAHAGQVEHAYPLAYALLMSGFLLLGFQHGDVDLARQRAEESLRIWRALGNRQFEAVSLFVLSRCASMQGDRTTQRHLLEEALALALAEPTSYEWHIIWMLLSQVGLLLAQGEAQQAQQQLEQTLARAQALGNPKMLIFAHWWLGDLYLSEGRLAQAEACYAEVARYGQQLGDVGECMEAQVALAQLACARGDARRAFLLTLEAVHTLLRQREANERIARGLRALAAAVCALPDPPLAAHLYGGTEVFCERLNVHLGPQHELSYQHDLAALRANLESDQLATAWTEGRTLSLEEALALVDPLVETLETASKSEAPIHTTSAVAPSSPGAPQTAAELSARQLEVLRLLAQSLTNPQIAERLVISESTVNTHVVSIYNKLGVNSRVAAANWAKDHRLFD